MPRFVVLYHVMPPNSGRSDHWDLMLELPNSATDENAACLATWALESQPLVGKKIKAMKLADHRRKYLTFEGALSERRGMVTRQMEGSVEWVTDSLELVEVDLTTAAGVWHATIQRMQENDFEIELKSGD